MCIYIYTYAISKVYIGIYIHTYISVYVCMRLLGMGRVFLGEVCAFTCTSCFFQGTWRRCQLKWGAEWRTHFCGELLGLWAGDLVK